MFVTAGSGYHRVRIHVQERPKGMFKTDKRDALSLANRLYTQLELEAQVEDKMQLVRHALPPTPAASQLKGLIQHRYELSHQFTRLRNKLTSICDQLFPELVQSFRDPNREIALTYREQFPTPQAMAIVSMADLQALRPRSFPSDAPLSKLQQLARETIGIKDADRQQGLLIEQGLLIRELRLVQEHLEILDAAISDVVAHSREGQILRAWTDRRANGDDDFCPAQNGRRDLEPGASWRGSTTTDAL